MRHTSPQVPVSFISGIVIFCSSNDSGIPKSVRAIAFIVNPPNFLLFVENPTYVGYNIYYKNFHYEFNC